VCVKEREREKTESIRENTCDSKRESKQVCVCAQKPWTKALRRSFLELMNKYAYIHIHMYICVWSYTPVLMSTYTYIYIYICMNICIYTYVYVSICKHVYVIPKKEIGQILYVMSHGTHMKESCHM